MTPVLYYHPFSSYSWKVLIPLYEAGTPFEAKILEDPAASDEWKRLWPLARFPLLVDEAHPDGLPEASIIIEYLDSHYQGAHPILPADPDIRLEARLLDRFFDLYVMTPMQRIVADRMREPTEQGGKDVEEAHAGLATAYEWLEKRLTGREWATGAAFSLADCSAAPALFYADWVHPIGEDHPNVAGYRARVLARPSVKRAVDEARAYRHYFPGGAPDRD
jgi:glutathione S-transferase